MPGQDCRLSDEVGWEGDGALDKPRFGALSDTPSCRPPPPPPGSSEVVRSKRVNAGGAGKHRLSAVITAAVPAKR